MSSLRRPKITLENWQHRVDNGVSMKPCGVLAVLLTLLPAIPAAGRWEGAQDNKPVSDLEQLTTDQLFNEAFDVCVRRALVESTGAPAATAAEASDYLNTIYPFAREKNGGTNPLWMTELFTAHTTKECQRAFRGFVSDPEKSPAVARKRLKPRTKTAISSPRRSQWTEELPPWLAPH